MSTDTQAMMAQFAAFINGTEYPFELLQESLTHKIPDIVPNDLSGKVAIITGANVGIGFETAKAIASMNAKKIILACRSEARGQAALERIKKETNFNNEIEVWRLDMASFKSVKEFSEKFLETKLALDILVSNAGVSVGPSWIVTDDGHEITAQVNHLSNVLLISNLYPALKKAADEKKGKNEEEKDKKFPRVVLVGSDVHHWASVSPTDPHPVQSALTKPDELQMMTTYNNSKLFNVLTAKALAKRIGGKEGIWVCSANPGYTVSELGSKDPLSGVPLGHVGISHLTPRETHEGAKTIIYAAISPNVGEEGGYYSEGREKETRTSARGQPGNEFADRVWEDTIIILKKQISDSPFFHL